MEGNAKLVKGNQIVETSYTEGNLVNGSGIGNPDRGNKTRGTTKGRKGGGEVNGK